MRYFQKKLHHQGKFPRTGDRDGYNKYHLCWYLVRPKEGEFLFLISDTRKFWLKWPIPLEKISFILCRQKSHQENGLNDNNQWLLIISLTTSLFLSLDVYQISDGNYIMDQWEALSPNPYARSLTVGKWCEKARHYSMKKIDNSMPSTIHL